MAVNPLGNHRPNSVVEFWSRRGRHYKVLSFAKGRATIVEVDIKTSKEKGNQESVFDGMEVWRVVG